MITFRHGLPDETWPAPDPEDPLSLIDQVLRFHVESLFISMFQVELGMAYGCNLTQKQILQYIHFNSIVGKRGTSVRSVFVNILNQFRILAHFGTLRLLQLWGNQGQRKINFCVQILGLSLFPKDAKALHRNASKS